MENLPTSLAASEFRRGWPLVLGGLVGTGLGFPAIMTNTIGILAPHLAREFGWKFGTIFGGVAVITIVLLLAGPIVGRLADRSDPRRMLSVAFVGLSVGYLSLALSSGSVMQYFASWLVICIAGLGATPIIFTRLINVAFDRHRGLALGIMLAGPGIVTVFLKPVANWAIMLGDWRYAVVLVGILPVFLGLPLCRWALAVIDGQRADQPGAHGGGEHDLTGLSLQTAMGTRAFRILMVLLLPIAVAVAAVLPHLENILGKAGLGTDQIVTLTSASGLALAAGRLGCGWLMDRIWAPLVGAASLVAAAGGCLLLASDGSSFNSALLAIVLLALAAGAEYDLLSFLVGRYFGLSHYGAIYGVVYAVFAVGAGFGPGVLGYAYDQLGSYRPILAACAMLLLGSACLLLSLGRYPAAFSPAPEENEEEKSHAVA